MRGYNMIKSEGVYTKFTDLNYLVDDQIKIKLDRWIYSIKFDSYAYVIVPTTGFDDLFILEGFNAEWRRQYIEYGFNKIDPIINKAQHYQSPNIWTSIDLSLDDQFLNCARIHGIRYGYSISLPLNEKYIGVLSVVRKDDYFISNKDSISIIGMMSIYLQEFNNCAAKHFNKSNEERIVLPSLTSREQECLHWLAEGKTSWEISRILSISERTAVFHINNCMLKLGAKNRVQAIMKAVRANVLK
ncbi:helix-turn-helix transcriptional regulator [Ewingella allii]|uniref:helix-turn-helix transcriptional regulator n=1 Tax=Ewingella allii TaxID=3092550 RepID=UPI0037A5BFDE